MAKDRYSYFLDFVQDGRLHLDDRCHEHIPEVHIEGDEKEIHINGEEKDIG